jgi:hypothetical protein
MIRGGPALLVRVQGAGGEHRSLTVAALILRSRI